MKADTSWTPVSSLARAAMVGVWLVLGCAPRFVPATRPAPGGPASSTVLPQAVSVVDPAGRFVVRGGASRSTHPPFVVVDLEGDVSLGGFEGHTALAPDVVGLALARSGGMVASLRGRRDEILVWDPRNRELLGRIRTGGGERVVGFAFSPDERSLMIATPRGFESRALPDGRLLAAWSVPGVRAFAAVPGRAATTWLAAVERPGSEFYVWLDERRTRTRRLHMPGLRGVEHLRISPDGRWLAVSAWGRNATDHLQVWDLEARRELAVDAADQLVNAIEFAEDSRTLVASLGLPCDVHRRSRLVAWDLERARTVVDIPLAPATSLRVARRAVLAVVGDEVLRVDLSSGRTTEVLKAACEPPCGLVLCG